MKYKVGDKVRVRENLKDGHSYGHRFLNLYMKTFVGKEVTISDVNERVNLFRIKDDGGQNTWSEEMFEPVESENATDETNVSDEWVLCKDDTESHADATEAAESADSLLELKFKEAVRRITPDELKEILLKKIEDSVENMSDDVVQDILAEALC